MLPMHCGHSPPAERPGATSRRALSTGQRQETSYVPSPAFCRARSATAPHALSQRRQSTAVCALFRASLGCPGLVRYTSRYQLSAEVRARPSERRPARLGAAR